MENRKRRPKDALLPTVATEVACRNKLSWTRMDDKPEFMLIFGAISVLSLFLSVFICVHLCAFVVLTFAGGVRARES